MDFEARWPWAVAQTRGNLTGTERYVKALEIRPTAVANNSLGTILLAEDVQNSLPYFNAALKPLRLFRALQRVSPAALNDMNAAEQQLASRRWIHRRWAQAKLGFALAGLAVGGHKVVQRRALQLDPNNAMVGTSCRLSGRQRQPLSAERRHSFRLDRLAFSASRTALRKSSMRG